MLTNLWEKRKVVFLALFCFAILLTAWGFSTPSSFPVGGIVRVEEGEGLYTLAESLKEERVIRSPLLFRSVAILLGGERNMKAGEYYFENKDSVFRVAWRILHADYRVDSIKLTIPEGFTVEKISKLFDDKFPHFDNYYFERRAPQGYLFPDTYFVPVTSTATSTIELMHDNFIRKIFDVMPKVESSGKTLEEVITMASLLEGEAKTPEDKEIISGILWKRLKIGMPLQVDIEMSTYEYPGLPEEPINNPGLVSIEAALNPKETPYLYFLTGHDGKMHYANTFEAHKANIVKYLAN